MNTLNRRTFLKQIGLGVGIIGTIRLTQPISLVIASNPKQSIDVASNDIDDGRFTAGEVIGINNDTLLISNPDNISTPILISSKTRVWKGRDISFEEMVDKVKVGDYAYCVTELEENGQLVAKSVWLNLAFPGAEVISLEGDIIRVRPWGNPDKENKIHLAPETEIWRGDKQIGRDILVSGVYMRVLGTVLSDKTLLAHKIYAAESNS